MFGFGLVQVVGVETLIFGMTYDQVVAAVSAVIAGCAMGWARMSNLRARAATATAVRANEQSVSNQSGVNDNYRALLAMQEQVKDMAVSIAQMESSLKEKDETIAGLLRKVEKVDALETVVKLLQEENTEYRQKLAEMQLKLDKANEIIERRNLK